MSDDGLVDAFGNAAFKAGRSNTAPWFSTSPLSDWEAMHTLGAALKKRLHELQQQVDASKNLVEASVL